MEDWMASKKRREPRVVDDGATRASVAYECRRAGLTFLDGTSRGWSKVDLASWLRGPYRLATRHQPRGERAAQASASVDGAPLDAGRVGEILSRAREQVLASLERAALAGGLLDFANEAVERGHVVRAFGYGVEDVYMPVDRARLRLADRVRALFAADYLDDDEGAYRTLFVCHLCEAVVFDAEAKRSGACGRHDMSRAFPREFPSRELR